ncbi:YBR230W-A-like protein [Saccharomyces cerevisiae x Saccharomyces kudriavzevii VIN7]|uniref:YBR230W-A-like protein n=1 Tax=Saccharomyces cerevisiae x Saccharomyces kudriavzevii (strain VIN7) TaxID=1095631 RepID=H0GRK3_SACCK|nr:YBR230W-A-like protein [Saccharomyces cerevisiae x Saccharomyces kudriavzevii VIN7]
MMGGRCRFVKAGGEPRRRFRMEWAIDRHFIYAGTINGRGGSGGVIGRWPGAARQGKGTVEKKTKSGTVGDLRSLGKNREKANDSKSKVKKKQRTGKDEKRIVPTMVCGECGKSSGQRLVGQGQRGHVRVCAHVQHRGPLDSRQTMGGCQGLVTAGHQRACCKVA